MMICLIHTPTNKYSLKVNRTDETMRNEDILLWLVSYVKTVRDLANKYYVGGTAYVLVNTSIDQCLENWKGDKAALKTCIFHLLFSTNMYHRTGVDVEADTLPHTIIDNLLISDLKTPSLLDTLATVAKESSESIWSNYLDGALADDTEQTLKST